MAFCIGCLWTMFLDHLRRTLTGSAQKDQKPYSTPEFSLTMAVRLLTHSYNYNIRQGRAAPLRIFPWALFY